MSREAYGGGGQYGGGSSGSSSSSGGNDGGNRESYGGGGQYSGGNTSTSTGGNGRNPTAQFNNFETPVNIPEGAKETLAAQRQKAQYEISPMTNPKNKAIALGLSMLVPGLGTLYGAYKNATAMGYSIDNPFEGIFEGGEPTLDQINNLGDGDNRDLQTQIVSKAPFILTQTEEIPSVVNEYFANANMGQQLSSDLQTSYNNAKNNVNSILGVNQQFGYSTTPYGLLSSTNLADNPFNIPYLQQRGLI